MLNYLACYVCCVYQHVHQELCMVDYTVNVLFLLINHHLFRALGTCHVQT